MTLHRAYFSLSLTLRHPSVTPAIIAKFGVKSLHAAPFAKLSRKLPLAPIIHRTHAFAQWRCKQRVFLFRQRGQKNCIGDSGKVLSEESGLKATECRRLAPPSPVIVSGRKIETFPAHDKPLFCEFSGRCQSSNLSAAAASEVNNTNRRRVAARSIGRRGHCEI